MIPEQHDLQYAALLPTLEPAESRLQPPQPAGEARNDPHKAREQVQPEPEDARR